MNTKKRVKRLFTTLEPAGGEDVRQVMDAARVLDVKEFDLFRLAWKRWKGIEADDKTIERAFAQYMLHFKVPSWVRQFARDVLRDKENGTLNLSKFGVSLVRTPPPPPPPHARLMVAGVAALACLFVFLLVAAPPDQAVATGLGCESAASGGPGMRFSDTVVRFFTGKPRARVCGEPYGADTPNDRGP